MRLRQIAIIICLVAPLIAQQRVDSRNLYERVQCVVPMVGSGTPSDPMRPAYAPLPPQPGEPATPNSIISFSYQVSDDGKHALVEFVAIDRAAFKDLMADKRPDVKVFVKGEGKRSDIETEFKKYKKDFNLDRFGVMMP